MPRFSCFDLFASVPQNAECFLVPSNDEYFNEFCPDYSNRLKFVTGFSGSNGIALLNKSGKHVFFTDGRYLLQAAQELDASFVVKNLSEYSDYIKQIGATHAIAIDPKLHFHHEIEAFIQSGVKFEFCHINPIDLIWTNRPIKPKSDITDFNLAGESSDAKCKKLMEFAKSKGCTSVFLTNTLDVSWFLNIRNLSNENALSVNKLAIISDENSVLFEAENLEINIKAAIKSKILLPHKTASYYTINQLKIFGYEVIFDTENWIAKQKNLKTASEIDAIKNACIIDSKTISEFLNFAKISKGETEFSLGEKLFHMRQKNTGFASSSFDVICGFQENGAIIHYHATKQNAKTITGDGLLLVDSGGQYYDQEQKICGTTDVTRTVFIGEIPKEEWKIYYTAVLKGHISLATAVFPVGTTGAQLDTMARQFLWQIGADYAHGTGHGIGYFLSVHEGPIGISKSATTQLAEGMVISNEPGFYKQGEFGIRLENMMLVTKHSDGFLCFEVLTKIPFEPVLINFSDLTDREIEWLSEYHINCKGL